MGRRAPLLLWHSTSFIFCLQIRYKIFIDKSRQVWYNINVKRTGSKRIWGTSKIMCQTPLTVDKKFFKEILKNLLTNYHFCGIINMSRGSHRLNPMEWLYGTETRPLATVQMRSGEESRQYPQKLVSGGIGRGCKPYRKIVANIFQKPLDKQKQI